MKSTRREFLLSALAASCALAPPRVIAEQTGDGRRQSSGVAGRHEDATVVAE